MWRVLATVLVCAGLAQSAEAKEPKAAANFAFCINQQDLLMYVVVRTTKTFKDHDMPGCTLLKKGSRYTALDDGSSGVIRIRAHMPKRGTVDGYAMAVGD